ncbi:hypothetical protein HK104_009392 [Borealophlyctis nickersoniae]|nr:hypothetical protein HK104_009392 [Borealophlyctis nickersoniae]
MPNKTTARTKKRRGRKLPAEPGPSEGTQLPPPPEIFALIFKLLNGSPRTLLTLRQACHTTKVWAERVILARALEHCRPTLSVTFPSSESRFYKTTRVRKDTAFLDDIVIECTDPLYPDGIHSLWWRCDAVERLEFRLEITQLILGDLAEKKGDGNVAQLIIDTITVVNVMRETLSGCWRDGREGGGEEEQLAAGEGVVDTASVLKVAQTELKAQMEKFPKESMWSRCQGETFESWIDAIGCLIRALLLAPDAATAKDLFGAEEVRLKERAAKCMQHAEKLNKSHEVLEADRNRYMIALNKRKDDKDLKAWYARHLGVPGGVFKNTGKFRVGGRVAPMITVATGEKTILRAPGTLIPKSTLPLSEMDVSLVKVSLGHLHAGFRTSRRGKVAGRVFGLGVLRGDELELLSIRIHTNVVGLCHMKCV